MKFVIRCFLLITISVNCKLQPDAINIFDINSGVGQLLALTTYQSDVNDLQLKIKYSTNDYPSFVKTGVLEIDLNLPVAAEFRTEHFLISKNYENDLVIRDVIPISNTKIRILFISSVKANWNEDLTLTINHPDLKSRFNLLQNTFVFSFPKNRILGEISEEKSSVSVFPISDTKILLVGGINALGSVVPTVEIFDIESGFSTILPPLQQGLVGAKLCSPEPGIVYVTGGKTVPGNILQNSEISNQIYRIDSKQRTVTVLGLVLTEPRFGHSIVCLPGSRILVSGGQKSANNSISSVSNTHELVHLETSSIAYLNQSESFEYPKMNHEAIWNESDQSVYFFGGQNHPQAQLISNSVDNSVQRLNLSNWMTTRHPLNLSASKSQLFVHLDSSGDFLNFVGTLNDGIISRTIEVWNPVRGVADTIAFFDRLRRDSPVSRFSGNQYIIAGGLETYYKTSAIEIYDHSEGKVFTTGSLLFQRANHSVVLVRGGIAVLGDPSFAGKQVEYYGKN